MVACVASLLTDDLTLYYLLRMFHSMHAATVACCCFSEAAGLNLSPYRRLTLVYSLTNARPVGIPWEVYHTTHHCLRVGLGVRVKGPDACYDKVNHFWLKLF